MFFTRSHVNGAKCISAKLGEFIDCDPHWYMHRVKEAIHIGLHPKNINRDSGIKIPLAWKPTIKRNNSQSMRTNEGTPSSNQNNNEDQNAPIAENRHATNRDT